MAEFASMDTLVAAYHQRGGQPGLAYGIVVGGELVHAAGLGERYHGGPPPDARTVFRIASMTKSFTASAILALRDEGALKLDDLAETYVPELRDWPPAAPDAARISIRHLLTMTAGFPTDDPWGDRQQGLTLDAFAAFLARGVRFNWAPGTRFEYSNLGFAILGRVITAVTGGPYPDYVRDQLLGPLGMTSTGYQAGEFSDQDLARGYRRSPAGWLELPFEPCGAFAPMGGIFSCVADLSRWVTGFAAAFPPRRRRGGRPPSGAAGQPPGDAAAPGGDRLGRRTKLPRRRGHYPGGRLWLRAVRQRAPGVGADRQPQRRVPRVRQQHVLAPGHRHRRDRARQQHLLADGAAGRPGARGGAAPGPAPLLRLQRGARPGQRPGTGTVGGDADRQGRGRGAAEIVGRRRG
jgi:CubicO group peptidase (beta-lactamase class C family)